MPKGKQLNAATLCPTRQEAGEIANMGQHEAHWGLSSWNPAFSLKHQVSEAYLLGPSTILQPAENSNKTKEGGGVRKGVMLNDSIIRDKGISPPEPWRLLCSIHQQAWGGKA